MTLIDTHTHLYLPEFSPEQSAAVERAIGAGVSTLIFPNVDLTTVEPMMALAAQYPDNVKMAMGLHPTEIGGDWLRDLDLILSKFDDYPGRFVAVGEIGIDLYWDKAFRNEQMEALRRQFDVAVGRDLPVIIHCREGLDETLEVIDSGEAPRGVFHSFGGTVDDVERIRRRGDYYFGINGIVTFKNSKLRDVLPTIGLDRMLLETDSPYLAPVPHRGKRNESAYVVHVAAYVADVLGLSLEEVAEVTTRNARRLFAL